MKTTNRISTKTITLLLFSLFLIMSWLPVTAKEYPNNTLKIFNNTSYNVQFKVTWKHAFSAAECTIPGTPPKSLSVSLPIGGNNDSMYWTCYYAEKIAIKLEGNNETYSEPHTIKFGQGTYSETYLLSPNNKKINIKLSVKTRTDTKTRVSYTQGGGTLPPFKYHHVEIDLKN